MKREVLKVASLIAKKKSDYNNDNKNNDNNNVTTNNVDI